MTRVTPARSPGVDAQEPPATPPDPSAPQHCTIDRFEGASAVLETAQWGRLTVPRQWLPQSAKEGDVLQVSQQKSGLKSQFSVEIDIHETARRRAQAEQLQTELAQNDPGGDIDL